MVAGPWGNTSSRPSQRSSRPWQVARGSGRCEVQANLTPPTGGTSPPASSRSWPSVEHWLTDISQNYPLLFGIMAVLIALGAGLLVGMIFKKGGHH